MFLIYVNDLSKAVPNISVRLFADDTSVFLYDKDCNTLAQKGICTLSLLKEWFDSNRLTLHLGKTNFNIFHPSTKAHSCCNEIVFNGTTILKSSSIKYLGLIIDDRLSWETHINDLCNTLVKYIGIFYHIRNFLPKSAALQIYYLFIYA